MKVDKIKVYFFEIILLAILTFALFVSKAYSRMLLAGILIISAIIGYFVIKKRKVESVDSKKVIEILLIFAIIYLIAFYIMGLYFGYYRANFTFSIRTLINYIIPTIIIIITSEIIRNILLVQKVKFSKIITLLITVLIDLILYVDIYNTNTYERVVEIIGFTLFASIACNLLYNYVSNRYGIKGNIVYRLITVLYVYIIPYIPNVYVFFRSILRMIYPYIIYQILEYTFAKNNMIIAVEDKRKNVISKVILVIVAIIVVMLVSCKFQYGILVIGSGSMTGAINKGDAVFFEQYDENEKIENGQVIIFKKNNVQVVHRVVDIKKINNEIRYTTKGDANQKNDDGYITNQDITGICKFRIAYIGYPTIWIRDMFSK